MREAAQPKLSVVVTVVSDTTEETDTRHLEGCLEALEHQVNPPEMEVLVTCGGWLRGIEELEQRFPRVRFIRVGKLRTARHGPSREHHDELRAVGIRQACGELVGLLEDHGWPDLHWCAQLVKEHRGPHAAIGGAIENSIDRLLNWGVYFCDFGRYQNPVPRGPATFVSDANVCYKRLGLDKVPEAWADSYNEVRVHAALSERGETLWLSPDLVVYQHRLNLQLGLALLERYVWGRSYAATRMAMAAGSRRLILAALSPVLPLILIQRQLRNVLRKRRNRGAFFRALPLTALLTIAWSYGEFVGYLTGRPATFGEWSRPEKHA
jgi:hypothetical protein